MTARYPTDDLEQFREQVARVRMAAIVARWDGKEAINFAGSETALKNNISRLLKDAESKEYLLGQVPIDFAGLDHITPIRPWVRDNLEGIKKLDTALIELAKRSGDQKLIDFFVGFAGHNPPLPPVWSSPPAEMMKRPRFTDRDGSGKRR